MLKKVLSSIFITILIYIPFHKYKSIKNSNGYLEIKKEFILSIKTNKIKFSDLKKGDILIRRYKTNNTVLPLKLFPNYFTHAAFYIGENKIVEASGKMKNRNDDIKVNNIYDTDWMSQDIENIFIIRPRFDTRDVENNLINITNDNEYKYSDFKLNCISFITNELYKINKFDVKDEIVSPDYFFDYAVQNKEYYDIIRL